MSKFNKQPIRDFMQKHYTDARLAELLAHAQDGKLAYTSCCCFIGVANANHTLRTGRNWMGFREGESVDHYFVARELHGGVDAEAAFKAVAWDDEGRVRILIPMIRAEMKRRANLRKVTMAAELNQPASVRQSVQDSSSFTNVEHAEKLNKLEQDVAK